MSAAEAVAGWAGWAGEAAAARDGLIEPLSIRAVQGLEHPSTLVTRGNLAFCSREA